MKKAKKRNYALSVVLIAIEFVMLFIGMVQISKTMLKVISTGADLIVINSNIQTYNEQSRKTNEMTEEYQRLVMERKVKYYNSSNWVVKKFSNSNALLKIVYILLAIAMYPAMGMTFIRILGLEFKKRKNRRRAYK